MSKEVLFVQPDLWLEPGIAVQVLDKLNVGYALHDMKNSELFPPVHEEVGAVVVLGAHETVHNRVEQRRIDNIVQGVRAIIARNIPYLGICFGHQAGVFACEGRIVPNDISEIGFRDQKGNIYTVELTKDGQKDPLTSGLDRIAPVFEWHEEKVELTPKMQLLGRGSHCKPQIVKIADKAYGLQCHLELDGNMLENWISLDSHSGTKGGEGGLLFSHREEVLRDYATFRDSYSTFGRNLFRNFFQKIAGLGE